MEQYSASDATKSPESQAAESNAVVCALCGRSAKPPQRVSRMRMHMGEELCNSCDLLCDKLEHEDFEGVENVQE